MKILTISGSLRENSIHNALLNEAGKILIDADSTLEIQEASIELPLYNEDIDDTVDASIQSNEAVAKLKQALTNADAIIIASPEYNHSLSGPLKNALDWASRPAFNSPLKDKPVAFFSASPGAVGGVRSFEHLRTVLASTLANIYPGMPFSLGSAHQAFSDNNLSDETAQRRLKRFLTDYLNWIKKL